MTDRPIVLQDKVADTSHERRDHAGFAAAGDYATSAAGTAAAALSL